MVLTSSTQWTIPLGSNSIAAASSPSLSKQGSVLGLKTCQLSAPPLAIASELHDQLHSTSSRRLQGGAVCETTSRRSAGSFRRFVSEDLCAKKQDYACTDISEWLSCGSKEDDSPYDGIAMPWSCRNLDYRHGFNDEAAAGFEAGHGSSAHLPGEITADDVDLLPMPGELSCGAIDPAFCADSYLRHAQRKSFSKRSTEISSPESSDNSCKSCVMVPNHLGLPPNFNVGTDGRATGNLPPFSGIGIIDSFSDALSDELWSIPAIDYDPDHPMLYESESLASIFNVFPQKFHGFSSSGKFHGLSSSGKQGHAHINSQGAAQFVGGNDELRNVGYPAQKDFDSRAMVSWTCPDLSANECQKIAEKNGDNMVWEATNQARTHEFSCNAAPHPNMESSHLINSSGMPSESSLTMDSAASSLEKRCEYAGMKRPYSLLQPTGFVPVGPVSDGSMLGKSIWQPQPNGMGLPMPIKEEEAATQSFSTMLFKTQKDAKLGGFYHHLVNQEGRMQEEMVSKPPPMKMRRKHGTAMDPQSIAARSRREKFSDRIRILQGLVPNGERLDTVAMLGQTLEYVKFLQHQVWQLYHGKDPGLMTGDTFDKWKDFIEAESAKIV